MESMHRLLCRISLAGPIALAAAFVMADVTFPAMTVSDVILSSPGLNIVAAGEQIMCTAFMGMVCIQHQFFTRLDLPSSELSLCLEIRAFVAVGITLSGAAVYIAPLPAQSSDIIGAFSAQAVVHYAVAGLFLPPLATRTRKNRLFPPPGLFVIFGMLEIYIMSRHIEPRLPPCAGVRTRSMMCGAAKVLAPAAVLLLSMGMISRRARFVLCKGGGFVV
jgi:hypothetical protein